MATQSISWLKVTALSVATLSLFAQQCGAFMFPTSRATTTLRRRSCGGKVLMMSSTNDIDIESLGLTPELKKITNGFAAMSDDRTRYKQLLFTATQAQPMAEALKTPEAKVQGCLSTVHVHADLKDGLIYFQGDSDAALTKGLVSILVKGLSGNTAEAIQQVQPEFIKATGLTASLTPGRNNGFINMLAKMKLVALEVEARGETTAPAPEDQGAGEPAAEEEEAAGGRPIYTSMVTKLKMLKPVKLEVIDESAGHAGHKEREQLKSDESHFNVRVIAEAFDGLSLVKRHQLIYTLLAEEMETIHAIQIYAKTPAEVGL
eukprot:CAMPEP_0113934020 /NCGR_PEP_ID=MMETSP1339-20121228/1358_1 /TAXON_ID=94617 /ORGANISM="Fibrocapsa japonica" /LENGTH=317 /DNA_ID=CAMNT_0000935625 /DNA_START=62 /DNA_END=1015 /DNA_ORIENTATION=+ /assembly_acc=CAM_ASM_000762